MPADKSDQLLIQPIIIVKKIVHGGASWRRLEGGLRRFRHRHDGSVHRALAAEFQRRGEEGCGRLFQRSLRPRPPKRHWHERLQLKHRHRQGRYGQAQGKAGSRHPAGARCGENERPGQNDCYWRRAPHRVARKRQHTFFEIRKRGTDRFREGNTANCWRLNSESFPTGFRSKAIPMPVLTFPNRLLQLGTVGRPGQCGAQVDTSSPEYAPTKWPTFAATAIKNCGILKDPASPPTAVFPSWSNICQRTTRPLLRPRATSAVAGEAKPAAQQCKCRLLTCAVQ